MYNKTNAIGPKTHQYLSNGTGRDNYIKINDGGLNKQNNVRSFTGGKFILKTNRPKNSKPNIEAKGLYYRSDGTGRDNYIICNEGGLTHFDKSIYDYKYVEDLRTYDKYSMDNSTPLRPDFFQSSQNFRSKKQVEKDMMNSRIQKDLVGRLSTPKTTANPHQYPNVFDRRLTKKTKYQ